MFAVLFQVWTSVLYKQTVSYHTIKTHEGKCIVTSQANSYSDNQQV